MSDDPTAQDQRIRERAYQLWEQEGRQHGAPDDHWHRARREVEQENERSGSPQDQQADDRTDPAERAATLPAAPEDEPAPALSATLEEAPGEPATAKPSRAKAAPKPAKPAAAPKPAAKPRKG